MFEGDDDLLDLLGFFGGEVVFEFFEVGSHVHEMNLATFGAGIIPEGNDGGSIEGSDSVDIIVGDGLLVEELRLIIGIFLFLNIGIIIKACPVKFGPLVKVDKVVFGVVATTLDCVDLIGVFGHGLEPGEGLEGRGLVDKVDR